MLLSKIEWFEVFLVLFLKPVLSSPKCVVNIFVIILIIIAPWLIPLSISSDPSYKLGQLEMLTFSELSIGMQITLNQRQKDVRCEIHQLLAVWGLIVEQCKAYRIGCMMMEDDVDADG